LLQVGVDYFYRFGYLADRYMTITQSFYLENFFATNTYSMADFFINAQMSKVRVFLRFSHLNQNIGANGYLLALIIQAQEGHFNWV
jgi:hypothetical protein